MSKTTKELLQARQAEVQSEIETIEKAVKPMRDARAKLQDAILPVEAEMRELQKKIRAIEQPQMSELRAELSALAQALGSKSMKAATAVVKGA